MDSKNRRSFLALLFASTEHGVIFLIRIGGSKMKIIIYFVLGLVLTNTAHAASVYYRFVGGSSEPEIDFTLEVDFAREGFTIDGLGNINYFDPSRDTFFVSYQYGNYSLAPSTNQFQRFYGEDVLTPEGVFGCLYALNSIGVCDSLDTGFGGVPTWQVGRTLTLSLFDSMGPVDTFVRLEGITAVPLPAPIFFMISGLTALLSFGRKKI